jgi:hypothetical protein
MQMTIKSTSMTEVNGVPGRVWIGRTERGVEVQVLVTRIAVAIEANASELEAELREVHAPKPEVVAFPLRMLL